MLYYDWKSIGAEQAQRALDKGASIWKLPIQFGNGMARFSYGLQTPRGTCYVVSDRAFQALTVPATAWAPQGAISPGKGDSPSDGESALHSSRSLAKEQGGAMNASTEKSVPSLAQFHGAIAPDVRDVQWSSNCAGEIFAEDGTEQGLRIGHFQGDADLAAFVVSAHEAIRTENH